MVTARSTNDATIMLGGACKNNVSYTVSNAE